MGRIYRLNSGKLPKIAAPEVDIPKDTYLRDTYLRDAIPKNPKYFHYKKVEETATSRTAISVTISSNSSMDHYRKDRRWDIFSRDGYPKDECPRDDHWDVAPRDEYPRDHRPVTINSKDLAPFIEMAADFVFALCKRFWGGRR